MPRLFRWGYLQERVHFREVTRWLLIFERFARECSNPNIKMLLGSEVRVPLPSLASQLT